MNSLKMKLYVGLKKIEIIRTLEKLNITYF